MRESIESYSSNRIVLFDGGMGTSIQKLNLDEDDWGEYLGCNEALCLSKPDIIKGIYNNYLDAGSDVITTNTFGASFLTLKEYGLESLTDKINTSAVEIAKSAISGLQNKYIAFSVGPGSLLPSLNQVSYEEMYDSYLKQIRAGVRAGVDLILIETCQDMLQAKIALNVAKFVIESAQSNCKIIISFTVNENGKLLVGTDISAICNLMSYYEVFAIGLNCGFGPDKLADSIKDMRNYWGGNLYLSPNAGLPVLDDDKFKYDMSAECFAEIVSDLSVKYKIGLVGGCCGTDELFIKDLSKRLKNIPYKETPNQQINPVNIISTYSSFPLCQQPRPTIVGERANATGSKAFRLLLEEYNYEAAAELAKSQEEISHLIDLNVALSGRNELEDMQNILPYINQSLFLPLMIDSTNIDVIEFALKKTTGKPVINSVSLEDDGKKLYKVLDLIKIYPASVVALTIDDSGMAQTFYDKVEIAEKIYRIWTLEYKFRPGDLIIDFLTFSLASGEEYRYSAVETLSAIKTFKNKFPDCATILGISNISYGLDPAGRQILNSVFCSRAVEQGLDMAIVNSSKFIPVEKLPKDILKLANDLIDGVEGSLDKFISLHTEYTFEKPSSELTSIDVTLRNKVINGELTGVDNLMAELLRETSPSDILSKILLPAMQEVGKLFSEGKKLLPFVLKSAEVMKKCSDILAPKFNKDNKLSKGKVVIATVKGDVHDIGKNLVNIILSGNGYEVIDLGVKVDVSAIIEAINTHKPVAIGMSGLLVRSTEIMKENLEELKKNNIDIKVMLGGAALNRDYVENKCSNIINGSVYYCKDIFDNLKVLSGELKAAVGKDSRIKVKNIKKFIIKDNQGVVSTPFIGTKTLQTDILKLIPLIKKNRLYKARWGFRENFAQAENFYNKLVEKTIDYGLINPCSAYGYFNIEIENNSVYINNNSKRDLFADFPVIDGASLADLMATKDNNAILPLQIVTLGNAASDFTDGYYLRNDYSEYYLYHGLFIELLEAYANYITSIIQSEFLYNGKTNNNMLRYSFGYPMCPDLRDNISICNLLNASSLNIKYNENGSMEPIYTTAAFLTLHSNDSD